MSEQIKEENNKRDWKGIWIPKEIWLAKDISIIEKCLWAEIDNLDNGKGCFASNDYFSNMFNISKTSISNHISTLKKQKYIKQSFFNGRRRVLNSFKAALKFSLKQSKRKLKGSFKENLESYIDNSIENNIDNSNTSKRSKNDSNESPKTSYNKSLFLDKDIYSLFKKVLSNSIIFNKHKLPETENDSCSKLLIQSQKYLLSFMNNSYVDSYVWNTEWKKKIDIFNNKTFFCTDIYLLFKKAIIRYNKMHTDGYWPYDKSSLTHNLSDFLYNPRTHKSWFLYCLCNIPQELKNENHIKIKESLPEDIQIMAEIYIKNKNWNEIEYYKKVNILYDWFNTNHKDLLKYNYVFYGGNIYSYMQQFISFFKLIDEYSTIYDNWSLSNFGYGNKTWSAFIKWILEKYGFDLKPDKDKLKRGVDAFNEKEAKRKEK